MLLEQDIIGKRRVSKTIITLDFKVSKSKKFIIETIWNSAIYIEMLEMSHLLRLHYLICWKVYLKKKQLTAYISSTIHLKTIQLTL